MDGLCPEVDQIVTSIGCTRIEEDSQEQELLHMLNWQEHCEKKNCYKKKNITISLVNDLKCQIKPNKQNKLPLFSKQMTGVLSND
ncbi:hypothetical protein MAR_023788 [Mya arenaria]|uniref:Uncharacterized protein n=1 Tax=Mya arenaria TaxID=6604 RepID=A0ABY7DST7_MYAAR|nr:hypothetical protein MAR_023788 [Mya arenaria]